MEEHDPELGMHVGPDGLTDRERRFVEIRRSQPDLPQYAQAAQAGYAGDKQILGRTASRMLRKPHIIAALTITPPTIEKVDFCSLQPKEQKEWLMRWFVRLVEDPNVPTSERIRALNAVSDMVPGVRVPVGVHHTGHINTLEKFIEAAGGMPDDVVPKLSDRN